MSTITQWTFNSPTPDSATNTGTITPAVGTGTASLVGTNATFATGLGNESDNSGWNTTSYPASGTGNKTEGVQFNVSTVGSTSLVLNFDIRHSNTSANTAVVQYSVDGTNFVDFQTFTVNQGDTWYSRSVDFSSIAALNNNPNAAFRVVSSFDPTTGNYRASTATSTYAGTGTLRFDNVSFTSGTATTPGNNGTATRIRDIQGTSHTSTLTGQTVNNIEGIVTAVSTGSSRGFWMQDPNPDNNNATSEGIFVFLGSSSIATPTVGQSVKVTGRVNEFRPGNSPTNLTTTQINAAVSGASVNQIASLGIIAPTVIGASGRIPPNAVIQNDFTNGGNVEIGGDFDPTTEGIDFYESLEGMLVQINNAVATSPTNNFGEVWVLPDNGVNATGRTSRGGSLISSNDFNPERIQIDDTLFSSGTSPEVNVGATFNTITGVVDYSFSNYEVLPTSLNVNSPGNLAKETTNLVSDRNNLTIAAFNVENLDTNDNDGDRDVADGKFAALANNIVKNLKSPDIISLEEIQDNTGSTNDGVVDASQTYNKLIQEIQAAGGPTYSFRQVNPANNQDGGQPGGNIRVGFLFNPTRVSFVDRPGGGATSNTTVNNVAGVPELSASPGRIDPTNSAFATSRKPLVGEFLFQGQTIFVVGNHFNSKGGDQPLFGPNQPPILTTETQRRQQAQIVNNFVDSILTVNPNANIVVLGDLNDFEFSEPLNILKGTPSGVGTPVLQNLVDTLPASERYTYNFQGNAQVLDHILVSNNLLGKLNGYDIVHINSEFVDQQSDHDPAVARFNFAPQPKITNYQFTNLPKLGTASNGRDIFLGGFSGLSFQGIAANGNLKFITHTDRGPNGENQGNLRPFFLPSFQPEVINFELNQSSGEISITNRIGLFREDGKTPLTGLPNLQAGARGTAYTDEVGVDLNGNTLKNDPLGADLEGIVVAENGDLWMVDEYRPAIYHFDSSGILIDRFIPVGDATDSTKNGGTFYGTPILPAVYAQRRNNRGFEAVALEGTKLYAFIQSAIDNPDNGGDTVSRASNNLRILEFDIVSQKVTGEYLYLLDNVTTADKIGDAVSLGNGKFAVVERDDNSDANAKKLIYSIDLAGATNINNTANLNLPTGKTIEQLTRAELAAANINPVSKNLIVNPAQVGYTGVDKLEGLALVAPNTLALINDNDFNVAGTNTPEKLGLIQLPENLPVATLQPTQLGTSGNDSLFGTSGNDVIDGRGGDDIFYAGEGNNILLGGAGNDIFYAGAGNDKFTGGEGNNTFYGGEGNNIFLAGSGNDVAFSGAGNDVFALGNGNNTIYAGEGNNRVTTGSGNDLIYAGAGRDVITAGDGNNTIYAGEGNNQVITGSGNDLIYAGSGNDIINTGAGDDLIYAGEGNNRISAGIGNDTVYVGSGSNLIFLDGGLGSTTIYGFTSNDQISRGTGLTANSALTVTISGNDTLISAGSDLLATLKWTSLNNVNIV
jgi:predicted extracellular nuclease